MHPCRSRQSRPVPSPARAAPALLAGLLAVLTSGCGPSPVDQSAAAPSASTPQLRLDGIDACALITPGLRQQLTAGNRQDRDPAGAGPDSSDCAWTNAPAHPELRLSLRLVRNQGIEAARGLPGARSTSVAGFPAVDLPAAGGPDLGCVTRVAVADGQSLWSGYTTDGPVPGRTFEDSCDRAHVAAQSEIGQLRSRVR